MVVLTTSPDQPPPDATYDYINTYSFGPVVFFFIILLLIIYFALGTTFWENGNIFAKIGGVIILLIVLAFLVINAIEFIFNVNITAYARGFFNPNIKEKEIDIVVNTNTSVPEIKFRKQVYNIPGNYYNFDNAKAVCQAYGSELATYEQIEKSYENGSEWCNYGWSADQLALFPTQTQTYDNLQQIKGHENDCGRPGINGGYIANPNVRFGVNCYGHKPRITEEEDDLMKIATPYPETLQDQAFQKRVDFWKTKINDILVSPFNHNTWSQI
tara:strand:+ start:2391 stop:3203 length:813 start_codon:yes stop_codon:yes gene_type:complete